MANKHFGLRNVDEAKLKSWSNLCKEIGPSLIPPGAKKLRGRPDYSRMLFEALASKSPEELKELFGLRQSLRARNDILLGKVRDLAVLTAVQEYLMIRDRVGGDGVTIDLSGPSPGPVTSDGTRQARIYEWIRPKKVTDRKFGIGSFPLHHPNAFAPYAVLRSIYRVTRPSAEFPAIVAGVIAPGIYIPRESYDSTVGRRISALLPAYGLDPKWREGLMAYARGSMEYFAARDLREKVPESELSELRLLWRHEANPGAGPAPLPPLQTRIVEQQYTDVTYSLGADCWKTAKAAIEGAPLRVLDSPRHEWERAISVLGSDLPGFSTP